MISFLSKLLAGPIVEAVVGVIKSYNERKMSEAVLRAEVEKAVLGAIASVAEAQADVIIAEANSKSPLVRMWRPIVAMAFAAVVMFYALVLPIAVDWFGAPPVRVGDALLGWVMQAVMVCLGGYIAGRSLEKIAGQVLRR